MTPAMLPGLIPWFMFAAFWVFVIWAIAALIGVLRDIRTELRVMNGNLRSMGDGRTSEERPFETR